MAVPAVQKKMLTLLIIAVMIVQVTKAATYTVGAPGGGWDMYTDLQTWGSIRTFYVGDYLYFSYSASHSVLEVTKTDYESCVTSNPIDYDTSGSSTVPLDYPTTRYFICGTYLHCAYGMRVVITTVAQSRTPYAKPPPSNIPWPPPLVTNSPPLPPTTRDSSSSSSISTGLVIGIVVGAVTALVLLCILVIFKRRSGQANNLSSTADSGCCCLDQCC